MHGIEEGLLDKGCAEASDLLYLKEKKSRKLNIIAECNDFRNRWITGLKRATLSLSKDIKDDASNYRNIGKVYGCS